MAPLAALALTLAAPEGHAMTQDAIRSTDLPRARDPDAAVREEFDAAREAGTVAAWDLFLERHPRHALVEAARRERAALLARGDD